MSKFDKLADGLTITGIVLGSFGLVALMACFLPFILMFAWNYVMPKLFGLPEIGFCEAFALSVVFSILTSGLRAAASGKE